MKILLKLTLIKILCSLNPLEANSNLNAKNELKRIYEQKCRTPSDINEHLPILKNLASECSSVVEIGVRSMNSTWGILQGLSDYPYNNRSYLGIDIVNPPSDIFDTAYRLSKLLDIGFYFWQANDMTIDIPETDLLFIDSLHTYCHLTYELEKFSPYVRKFIALHDTSAPWGSLDDDHYYGDYSEYPSYIDRTKKGLWAAVEDFLKNHSEWILHERKFNNHGFTILKRVLNQ